MKNALLLLKRRQSMSDYLLAAFAEIKKYFKPSTKRKTKSTSQTVKSELELFERYKDDILRMAISYLRNKTEAEDILQDVFVKVLQYQPEFVDQQHEKAWLLRVTINLCKNKLQKNKRTNYDELTELVGEQVTEDLSYLWEALGKLPESYREVLHLFYYEQLKTKEIAKLLEKNENTVRSTLARGRGELKQLLEGEYGYGEL